MNITPLNSRIIVKLIKLGEQKKGLIIVNEQPDENPTYQVMQVASEVKDINIGDYIICNKYSARPVTINDEELHIVNYIDVVAILDNLIIEEQNGIL